MTGFMLYGRGNQTVVVYVARTRDNGGFRESLVRDVSSEGVVYGPGVWVSPSLLRSGDRMNDGA